MANIYFDIIKVIDSKEERVSKEKARNFSGELKWYRYQKGKLNTIWSKIQKAYQDGKLLDDDYKDLRELYNEMSKSKWTTKGKALISFVNKFTSREELEEFYKKLDRSPSMTLREVGLPALGDSWVELHEVDAIIQDIILPKIKSLPKNKNNAKLSKQIVNEVLSDLKGNEENDYELNILSRKIDEAYRKSELNVEDYKKLRNKLNRLMR